jgi:hypothetical protein
MKEVLLVMKTGVRIKADGILGATSEASSCCIWLSGMLLLFGKLGDVKTMEGDKGRAGENTRLLTTVVKLGRRLMRVVSGLSH